MSENVSEPLNLDALKAGDRMELARMVEMYSDQVYRVALKILNDSVDAEDVLQETFLKAFRALEDFEGRSSISTWLYRIAVNESLMLIRKRKPEFPVTEEPQTDEENEAYAITQIVDWCCLPEKELLSSEARNHLDRAVQNLPDQYRTVFILRDIEGLSIRETAEALDLTETNVKTRLLRARLKLRDDLSQYYGERLVEID